MHIDNVTNCCSSIGPDLWIPIQICLLSLVSAMQFFLSGRASFLATRYLMQVNLSQLAALLLTVDPVPRFKVDLSRMFGCLFNSRHLLTSNRDTILYLSYWYTGKRVSRSQAPRSPAGSY